MYREIMMTAYLAGATACDLKWQRIPNELILFGYLLAAFCRCSEEGIWGLVKGLLCGTATIAMLYFFYLAGAVGAGDIKLFSVIGAVYGIGFMWANAFYALLAAGAAALAFALWKRQLFIRFYLLFSHISACIRCRRFVSYSALEQEGYLHFALYISLGYLFIFCFRKELQ